MDTYMKLLILKPGIPVRPAALLVCRYVLLMGLLQYGTPARAQKARLPDGIFLTEQAYRDNKPDYVLADSDRIQFNGLFEGRKLKFTCQGRQIKLEKEKIFGYRYQQADFRLYHRTAYQILDTAGFVLYSKTQLPLRPKISIPEEAFYYSLNEDKKIMPLTLYNFLHTFKKQTEFRYLLSNSFRSDRDLIEYDENEHQYKIKYLYARYMAGHR